jgi:hypothetical protein
MFRVPSFGLSVCLWIEDVGYLLDKYGTAASDSLRLAES